MSRGYTIISTVLLTNLWEKHPEDIVEEKSCEQQCWHFETGQPDEGYEGDTEAHAHEVHQGPVAGHHPDTDHQDGDADREQLRQGEPAAHAQRDLALLGAGSDQVLAHRQQQEGQGDGGDDCGADGEQQLHRVEEEEHDEEGEGGAQGETHGVQAVDCGHVGFLLLSLCVLLISFCVLHGKRPKGTIDN